MLTTPILSNSEEPLLASSSGNDLAAAIAAKAVVLKGNVYNAL